MSSLVPLRAAPGSLIGAQAIDWEVVPESRCEERRV